MTEQQHPIVPPSELVRKWQGRWHSSLKIPFSQWLANCGTQWGADQELEACLKSLSILWDKEEIVTLDDLLKHLRAARRPKTPRLKAQALAQLTQLVADLDRAGMREQAATLEGSIRRALEQLND